MKWRKLGPIFQPDGNYPWMRTHAANPVAEHRAAEVFRIYFSSRDERNRSSIAWLEIDLRRPTQVLRLCERPVLEPGPAGAFDDSGASMGCLVARADGSRFLLLVGWHLEAAVPWRNRWACRRAPVRQRSRNRTPRFVDTSPVDPHSLSYPWVLAGERGWMMWYGSNLSWGPGKDDTNHVIKCAESRDGIAWTRDGGTALGLRGQRRVRAFPGPAC